MAIKTPQQTSSSQEYGREYQETAGATSSDTISSVNDKYVSALNNVNSHDLWAFARQLGIGDRDLDRIEHDYKAHGIEEIKYQVALCWKRTLGKDADDKCFARALKHIGHTSDAETFLKEMVSIPSEESGEAGVGYKTSRYLPSAQLSGDDSHRAMLTGTHSVPHTPKRTTSRNPFSESPSWMSSIFPRAAVICSFFADSNMVTSIALLAHVSINVIWYFWNKGDKDRDIQVGIRSPSRLFTGTHHENCLQRIGKRGNNSKRVTIELIHGLGGCGKTEIVNNFVWNNWRKYSEVFILCGHSTSLLDFSLKKVLQRVLPEISQEYMTSQNIRRLAIEWMSNNHDWLLVIEDADQPHIIKQFIPEYTLGHGHIIITSRLVEEWEESYADIIRHPVEPLSIEDSAIYLLRATCRRNEVMTYKNAHKKLKALRKNDPDEFEALMWLGGNHALHGLPLALKQAGNYIREANIRFEIYKKIYKKCATGVFKDRLTDPVVTWLTDNGMDAGYSELIRDAINDDLLQLKTLPVETLQKDPICMTQSNLQKFKAAQEHTDIQYFAKIANRSRRNVLTTWTINYKKIREVKRIKEFLHICACLSPLVHIAVLVEGAPFLNPCSLKDFILATDHGQKSDETTKQDRVIQCFRQLQTYSFAVIMVGKTKNKHKRSLGRMGEFTLHHVLQQVVLFNFVDGTEKVRSINNAISMLENLFPKLNEVKEDVCYPDEVIHDRHSIIAFHTLALSTQMESLTKEEVPDINHPGKLFAAVGTYLHRLGKTADAVSLCKMVVKIGRWQKLTRKMNLADDLRFLGKVYFELNELDKAEECFAESLDLYKRTTDDDDLYVAKAMQSLARVQQHNPEYIKDKTKCKEIEDKLIDVLHRKEKHFAEINDDTNYSIAYSLHQLGRFYQDIMRYEESETYLNKALDMEKRHAMRQYDTDETLHVAIRMTNLARNYLLEGEKDKMDEAERLLKKAFEIKKNNRPSTSDSFQIGAYYLAVLYWHHIKDLRKSEEYLDKLVFDKYKLLFRNGTMNGGNIEYPPDGSSWL
ncbi:uncharacterized protein LOC144355143 [Saccoglossus kowalevskii]